MSDIYDTISRPRQGYIMPPAPQQQGAPAAPAPPPAQTDPTIPPGGSSHIYLGHRGPPPVYGGKTGQQPTTTTGGQGGTWQHGWQAGNVNSNTPEGQSIAQQFQAAFGNPYAGANGSGSNTLTNSQWIIVPASDAAAVQQMQQQAVDPSQILAMRDASGNIVAYVRSDKNIRPEFQDSPHTGFFEDPMHVIETIGAVAASAIFGPEILAGFLGDEGAAFAGAEAGGELLGGELGGAFGGLGEMAPLTMGEFAPMLDVPTFADSLTPSINSLINGDLPFPMPDPVMQPPPTVDIPPPDINITSGGGSLLDRTLGYAGSHPLQVAGLGLTAASMFGNHPNGVPQNLTDTVNQNKPLGDQARTDLINRGQLSDAQRGSIDATIDQQYREGREAIIQASTNAGQGGADSMVVQDKLRAFKGQVETMRQELYMKQTNENILVALQELGLVTQEQFALAQIELQQETGAQQRAQSIMQSLGWLWAVSGKG